MPPGLLVVALTKSLSLWCSGGFCRLLTMPKPRVSARDRHARGTLPAGVFFGSTGDARDRRFRAGDSSDTLCSWTTFAHLVGGCITGNASHAIKPENAHLVSS